ncbi:MAG: leader peptide processing enzyme [Treponema sp.]|jgi:membrane protein implicated in regulation of membrane protease activity|nr:leader peptide processing enzyme [Treponema sp.]
MNKKANTLLFILGATVVNIVVTIISFILLFVLYAKYLVPHLPESAAAWGFPVIFIISIALSFLLYRAILKMLLKKVDPEKYFDPLFGRRRKK